MQQRRIKYFNILLHSFAVANKSLTGLLPEHVLQASDVGSPLDLLFVQEDNCARIDLCAD